MTDVFDLYGMLDMGIDEAANLLTRALEIPFNPHDSSYWGEYYLARNEDWTEKLTLKENFNKMEDDWNKPKFKEYPLILEASLNSGARAHEVEECIKKTMGEKAVLLEREEYAS